jgi:hypothetical protein
MCQSAGSCVERDVTRTPADGGTFVRWLKALEGAEAARKAAEFLREQRLLRRRRGLPLCKSKRSIASRPSGRCMLRAMMWSGMAAAHYAAAHYISAMSLRRWRDLLESGEVDWRALFIRL